MRLCRFEQGGRTAVGFFADDRVIPLPNSDDSDLLNFLARHVLRKEIVPHHFTLLFKEGRALARGGSGTLALSSLTLDSPRGRVMVNAYGSET